MPEVQVMTTDQVPAELLAAIRSLLDAAFGDDPDEAFTDDDWDHTVGGRHVVVLDDDGTLLAHAAVVARTIWVGEEPFRAGYVEGVATRPGREGEGLGSLAVGRANVLLHDDFELGVLGTGRHSFYERLGWYRWQGPSFVRHPDGLHRTAEDDDGLMVLPFGDSQAIDLTTSLACEPRPGDDW